MLVPVMRGEGRDACNIRLRNCHEADRTLVCHLYSVKNQPNFTYFSFLFYYGKLSECRLHMMMQHQGKDEILYDYID